MPDELDKLTEHVRVKLGISRSYFYRYAVTRLLQEMSVLSTKAKEGLVSADETEKALGVPVRGVAP